MMSSDNSNSIPTIKNKIVPGSDFGLESMQDLYRRNKGETSDAHRHTFYVVIWVKKGEGTHIIDFNEYTVSAGQVYFVSPGQVHQLNLDNEPDGWVFTFSEEFLIINNIDKSFIDKINLFNTYSDRPPVLTDFQSSQRLGVWLEQMQLELDTAVDDYKSHALAALLRLFLIECVRLSTSADQDSGGYSCVLVDFRSMVEQHFQQRHKVAEYAELMSITPKYLNQVVKNTIGCTAKEYITDRIITEAKRMLIHSTSSAKHIAFALGFTEPVNFSNFFRKNTRMTPLQYRKTYS